MLLLKNYFVFKVWPFESDIKNTRSAGLPESVDVVGGSGEAALHQGIVAAESSKNIPGMHVAPFSVLADAVVQTPIWRYCVLHCCVLFTLNCRHTFRETFRFSLLQTDTLWLLRFHINIKNIRSTYLSGIHSISCSSYSLVE